MVPGVSPGAHVQALLQSWLSREHPETFSSFSNIYQVSLWRALRGMAKPANLQLSMLAAPPLLGKMREPCKQASAILENATRTTHHKVDEVFKGSIWESFVGSIAFILGSGGHSGQTLS